MTTLSTNQTKPSVTKPTAHSTTLKITTEKAIETEDTTKISISTTNPTKISSSKSTLRSKSGKAKGMNPHKNDKMKVVFSEKYLICYRSHRFA